jgi:hypothetical protein
MLALVSLNYSDLILKTFSDLRPVNLDERKNKHFGDFLFSSTTEEYGKTLATIGRYKNTTDV